MIKNMRNTLIFLFCYLSVTAQDNQKKILNGYALKGMDTLHCKVVFAQPKNYVPGDVILLIDNQEMSFSPGGPITGFGYTLDTTSIHFGTLEIEMRFANRMVRRKIFARKIVAGTVNLFSYHYLIRKTKSVNTDSRFNQQLLEEQKQTDYYISKFDAAHPQMATPVKLNGFRKKDLEKYIGDNTSLFAEGKKRYKLEELIATLEAYNQMAKQ